MPCKSVDWFLYNGNYGLKYCSWIWLFNKLNKRINRLHERAFWLLCKDYNETFEKLLERYRSCAIHEKKNKKKNYQLAIEICKFKNGLASENFESMFVINSCGQNLISVYQKSILTIFEKSQQDTYVQSSRTLFLWNKKHSNFIWLKGSIKKWKPDCSCLTCINYISGVGFVIP